MLDGFLSGDFPGAQALRQQVEHVRVKQGCGCGCGTIEFVHDGTHGPRSSALNPVPVDAIVTDPGGSELGGLILFVSEGLLTSLEIYSHAEPLPLPDPQHVIWRA